jgi:hypothetical protein
MKVAFDPATEKRIRRAVKLWQPGSRSSDEIDRNTTTLGTDPFSA